MLLASPEFLLADTPVTLMLAEILGSFSLP
jgi:hypothetical protein